MILLKFMIIGIIDQKETIRNVNKYIVGMILREMSTD